MSTASQNAALAVDLQLSHGGLRFAAAEHESAYRAWRNEQNLPIVRLNAEPLRG